MKLRPLCLLSIASALFAPMLALAVDSPATAASYRLLSFEYPVKPVSGVFYDPSQSGTGLTVDSAALNGQTFFFGTYYHYAADGRAIWLNMGQPLQQASIADYAQTGIPASIHGQWTVSDSGQCFDCAYAAPATANSPYGERVINVLDGGHLRLPASGNAADINLKLARSLDGAALRSKALLESGAVWAVTVHQRTAGVESTRKSGWVRFAKRDAAKNYDFQGFVPTSIDNGQGGVLPSTRPAWLDIPGKNDIAQQYEAVLVYSSVSTVGDARQYPVRAEPSARNDDDWTTFLIDPASDRIVAYERCSGGCPTTSAGRTDAWIRYASVLLPAGPSADGTDRLVMRTWSQDFDGFLYEAEFTRVPLDVVRSFFPTYQPTAN